ncbi:MAG: hypothetical protein FWE21_07955 [Defluviitaleaceae bacterium]|nr:hypothetical protein [Defluviitaleaceae bacterium]
MANYLDLIEQKTAAFERILDATKKHTFTGAKEAAEEEGANFARLYEEREHLFARVKKLEEALKACHPPSSPSGEEEIALATHLNKQQELAKEILAMDEANIKLYETFKTHITGDLKGITQTKQLNEAYMEDFEVSGYYFDKKN